MSGHYIGVDVNGINRIDHRDSILMAENIQNIAAIAFGTVGDEDLIVRNIDAFFAVIVFRNGVAKKFVALFRAIAREKILDARVLRPPGALPGLPRSEEAR